MKRLVVLAMGALMAAQLFAACSSASEDKTFALPTSPVSIQVPTQSAPHTGQCPATQLPAVTLTWDAGHQTVSFSGPKVLLPFGFSGRMLPSGRLQIIGPGDTVVAQDGDTLKLGGADYAHICRVQGVEH
ncbi:MAG TPA: hypothetical protein VF337_11735 [Candidatus Limnocylindrales bacterium]